MNEDLDLPGSFYRFEAINETDQGAQFLLKITPVDIATVNISQDEDGVIQVTEKEAPERADAGNGKYRLEPEGDLFRLYATVDFGDVEAGERGGLVQARGTLSEDGDCWVFEGSTVTGPFRVGGHALIFDSDLNGHGVVTGSVKIYSSRIDSTRGHVDIGEAAQLHNVTIDAGTCKVMLRAGVNIAGSKIEAVESMVLAGGCYVDAHLRNPYEYVSVRSTRWGWVSAYRATGGVLVYAVGCQRLGTKEELRAAAHTYGAAEVERAMLEGFMAMVDAAQVGWVPDPQPEVPLMPPVASFADMAQRARAVNLDDAATLRDQIHAANTLQSGGVLRRGGFLERE